MNTRMLVERPMGSEDRPHPGLLTGCHLVCQIPVLVTAHPQSWCLWTELEVPSVSFCDP